MTAPGYLSITHVQEEVLVGVRKLLWILSSTYNKLSQVNSFTGEIIPRTVVVYSLNKRWASTVCQQLSHSWKSRWDLGLEGVLKGFDSWTSGVTAAYFYCTPVFFGFHSSRVNSRYLLAFCFLFCLCLCWCFLSSLCKKLVTYFSELVICQVRPHFVICFPAAPLGPPTLFLSILSLIGVATVFCTVEE